MPVKGAAGIMLADARAAVRNNASRRVIGPVICVEDETAGAPKGYDASGTPASRHSLRMSGRARKARLRGAGQLAASVRPQSRSRVRDQRPCAVGFDFLRDGDGLY